jgi:putative nucleotidyltransferase with HDIG domain
MTKNTPEALVASVVHLIALPSVYTLLEEILNNPNHTRDDIAQIVSADPVLCARILRVVNSSYYGLPKSVQNIATAVNLIGEYDIRNLVLVTSVVNSMSSLVDDGIDIFEFWQHSIRCGIAARLIAKKNTEVDPELLFLCGLLHDLGQLVIYKKEPELSATVSWHVINEGNERYQVEQNLLGFDHAEVGGLLLESWGLSEKINTIIKCHHQADDSHYQFEAELVSFADHLSHFLELNENVANIDIETLPVILKNFLSSFGIQIETLFELLSEVKEQSRAIEEIIIKA